MLENIQPKQKSQPGEIQSKPSIWDQPDSGLQWCDCEADHPLEREDVEDIAMDMGLDGNVMLTHQQLAKMTMELWNYIEVCRFFHLHLNAAATHVHGNTAGEYPYDHGLDIIGYFSKTWQGCPEEVCAGGFS